MVSKKINEDPALRHLVDTQEMKAVVIIVETHTYTQYEVIYLKTSFQGKR